MQSILETVYEYQMLLGRRATHAAEFSEEERTRLGALRSLLRGDTLDAEDHGTRIAMRVKAELTTPTGFLTGEVHDVSGGGAAIALGRRLSPGTQTLVSVHDEASGEDYVFPGRVVWCAGRVHGIAFDGVPSKSSWPMSHGSGPFARRSPPLFA